MTQDWTTPDWSREVPRRFWDPSRQLLQAIRAYQKTGTGPVHALRRKIAVLRHRFWSVISQAEIDLGASIGGGLLLPHPNGIVIHPKSEIGPNCPLFQQVTLGTREGHTGAPRLGVHVDVPAHAAVVGTPAKILKRKETP